VVHRGLKEPKVETAHAILRLQDKYILQLRDDSPKIASCGQWSLFGGKIESGETPLEAIKRELFEELSIRLNEIKPLWSTEHYYDFVKGVVRIWFFVSCVDDVWSSHSLKEGKKIGVFHFRDLTKLDIPDVIRQSLHRFNSGENK